MTNIIKFVVPKIPLLIYTTINHYLNGSPQPSWDLKFHLIFELIQSPGAQTIKQAQALSCRPIPVLAGIMINESKIDNKYRYKAQVHLDKILKPYEHILDAKWKDLKENGVAAEWVQVPDDGWEKREIRKTILYLYGGAYYLCSKGFHHKITNTLAKQANARVFAIDYQFALQNPFPAGLQDVLAAYLYLLNPPKDAEFEPLNSENIVISGDSAKEGLSIALDFALHDSGLPLCTGIVGLSPQIDLTTSMLSILDEKCTDILPNPVSNFQHAKYSLTIIQYVESQVLIDYKKKAAALIARIKKQNLGPKIWHDSFDKPEGRINMYVSNEGLAILYVSPMLAESLDNLPPLLLIVKDEERPRDEIIYAHKSAEPTKYKDPTYNAGKFERLHSKFQQMLHLKYMKKCLMCSRVINTLPSSYNHINSRGEFGPLNKHDKEILNWDKIGTVPNVRCSGVKVTSHGP